MSPGSTVVSTLELEQMAKVEVTSEDPNFSIESALVSGTGPGARPKRVSRSSDHLPIILDRPRRRHVLDVLDDMGIKKRLALFSSKNELRRPYSENEAITDPIALDKTNQLLGHVTTTDQGALWQELMGHPKKIDYDPSHDFTLSAGIKGEAIWFDLDSA